jgi:hypothetical protein
MCFCAKGRFRCGGDLDHVISTIDHFAYRESFLMNVGDEKGALLDAAIARAQPARLLELGTYCGYSALRAIRVAPGNAQLVTIEFNVENVAIARSIFEHAVLRIASRSCTEPSETAGRPWRRSATRMASRRVLSTSSSSITPKTPVCRTSSSYCARSGCGPERWS